MGRAETFEHTADLGLRVEAASLEDLFETAALGLFGMIVANLESVKSIERHEVELESDSTVNLLVAWLNELIFESETRHEVYARFEVEPRADGLGLHAMFWGEAIDSGRHVLDHEVKAVTWHGLELEYGDGMWRAEMIVDI